MKSYYADISVFIEAESEDEANRIVQAAEDTLNNRCIEGITSVTGNPVSCDEEVEA